LALNTGMTQKDLGDLAPNEIDWKAGTITRRRSKTRKQQNPPTVSYLLWRCTWDLLLKYAQRTGEHALLTEDGKPYWTEQLVGNRLTKYDGIGDRWNSFRRRHVEVRSFKYARKTSPSLLRSNPRFAYLANYFLANCPSGIGEKHYYGDTVQESFNEAIKWLATQYGIE
jgi:integrase